MRTPLAVVVLVLASACGGDPRDSRPQEPTGNPWNDDTLWSVLEARDHRDTTALLQYLGHARADVRTLAALAFASRPDSTAMPALIAALADVDPAVRKAAALAIGNATDSIAWRALARASETERDTAVRRVMLEQAFKAEVDLGLIADPARLLDLLGSGNRSIRMRAAQQLGRSKAESMAPLEGRLLEAAGSERDAETRLFLVGALKHYRSDAVKDALMRWAGSDSLAAIRVSALRALGARTDAGLQAFFLERMNDGSQAARLAAIEQLQRIGDPLDAQAIWEVAQTHHDPFTQIPLYGLVLKHGDAGQRLIARKLLGAQAALENMPYAEAAILRAIANDPADSTAMHLKRVMAGAPSLVERTTALEELLGLESLAVPEGKQPPRARIELLRDALRSEDPGLATIAAEEIAAAGWAPMHAPDLLEALQRTPEWLDLPRDLECALAVERAIARCNGEAMPAPHPPAFNHPIDHVRLVALKDGQRYRMKTTKGEIVIALEPLSAPGSCVAFDSLATAGYYSGKFFHRVIPNFVAQGGCPRGDGWGGMDWTLRTEVGYEGFTRGAVGLASAGRDTESCQFFIMTAAAPHLDGRYTRFARVVAGLEVAEQLAVGDRVLAVERER